MAEDGRDREEKRGWQRDRESKEERMTTLERAKERRGRYKREGERKKKERMTEREIYCVWKKWRVNSSLCD